MASDFANDSDSKNNLKGVDPQDIGAEDDPEALEEAQKEREKKAKAAEFARMLDASFAESRKRLSVGDKIRGEILVLGKEEVFVSTGTMNDGIVSRKDLLDAEGKMPYKTGDVIDLFVTQVKGSEIYLSPKPTAKNIADDLEDAFDMMIAVEGRVAEVCKGGFRVSLMGKLAFCPISQMDLRHVDTPEDYVGKRFEFRITQFSEGGRNIVVSRRKVLEEERELNTNSFAEEHGEGDIVKGRITRIEKFGAFVELAPGIDGLAHVSELRWSRVENPEEVVQVGQEVTAKILKKELQADGKLRISLSLKQVEGEPWERIPAEIRPGEVVEGRVTRCMKFGAFVELVPGIEGLIPMSEMSYTKRVMRSDELVKEGERVLVMIKEVNPETRRISLSLKDAGADPWALVPQKFPVGTIVPGKVERREPYGLFIRIDEGVVGLLPKSKALEHPDYPFEKLRPGEETTVQIAEIRQEERRISLDVPKDSGSEDWKAYASAQSSATGTLGSTFGGAFGEQLKKALEKKKK